MVILAIIVIDTGCLDRPKCEMMDTFMAIVVLLDTFLCEFRIGRHDKRISKYKIINTASPCILKTEINLDLFAIH